MSKYTSLSEFVSFNSEFRNAINLYLNLNNREKILSYIPTKSSVEILRRFLYGVQTNTLHTSMLIGPYGKGKSHLMLVLLAVLSMDRNSNDDIKVFNVLCDRIGKVDVEVAELVRSVWFHEKGRFLPVIVNCQGDVNQAFLLGLNDALNRYSLEELTPKTYFEYAVEVIATWKKNYKETYEEFCTVLKGKKVSVKKMNAELLQYNSEYLEMFKELYPLLTSGSVFNPLVEMDVTRLYSSVADKLREEYGYRGIYIVFDEFSKFIEGQDKIASGINMQLIQSVCEMAGDSKDPQIHMTLIAHKPIKEYGNLLRQETINSFTGIEGRLDDEIYFKSSAKNNYELIQNAIIKNDADLENVPDSVYERYFSERAVGDSFALPGYSTEFTIADFEKIVVRGCYPMTPVATYVLQNISEKVAQNERTLFTFISKDEQKSMVEFVKKNTINSSWAITPDLVYDYFSNLLKNERDEIKSVYRKSVVALDMAGIKYGSSTLQIKILKALALLLIVDRKQELPWDKYTLRIALDMNYSEDSRDKFDNAIKNLEQLGVIDTDGDNLYRFKTIEGAELEDEINKRWKVATNENEIGTVLQKIYDLKYVFPKRYNYEFGITRYFRFDFREVSAFLKFSSDEVLFSDGLFCDGKIIALYQFDEVDYSRQIEKQLNKLQSKKLVVMYVPKMLEIRECIEKVQVLQNIKEDKTFVEKNPKLLLEIEGLEETLEDKIKEQLESMYGRFGKYSVFFNYNEMTKCSHIDSVGEVVDALCHELYRETPVINNELINKQNIVTGATRTVRKNIMERLLSRKSTDEYLKGTSQDATIYRALFINNGLETEEPERRIKTVIDIFYEYLDSCTTERQEFSQLVNRIVAEPYGLRLGVVPIYMSYVIGKRCVDTVIYYGDKEIPLNADTLINMCDYPQQYSVYISLEDENREKYLKALCELFNVKLADFEMDSRINKVLEGMQKWYRALPQVTKNVKKDDSYFTEEYCMKAIRRLGNILQRYEVNPYEAIFIQVPEAFGTVDNYEECILRLTNFKEHMSGYFYYIANKAVFVTKSVFGVGEDTLYHGLLEWYDCQSEQAKGTINDQKVTALMGTIAGLIKISKDSSYDDIDIIQKLVKAVVGVYVDFWNSDSLQQYEIELQILKEKIESMSDTYQKDDKRLVYVSRSGAPIYYELTSNEDTELFKDILSGTISDFEGLGKNDLIAILLDEVERIISKED